MRIVNYKVKKCVRCGKEFKPTSGRQKYCLECRFVAHRQYGKRCYIKHSEQKKQYEKQWRKANPKYDKQRRKTNPEQFKIKDTKHRNKREHNFGFIPLNQYFEGSIAHHEDKNYVIYMDKKDHESISHCLETGKNMDIVNALAMNYLGGKND